jgi:4-amino-4-deoxy-L-arabinose transferase-like glycosyltransferase
MLNEESLDSPACNRLFIAAFIALLVWAIGHILVFQDLWFTDEARVAGIAIQMADRQLYSVPYLGAEPFVEKPPLYFASAAVIFSLFGDRAEPTWTIRLASLMWGLLAALATAALAYTLARQYSGRQHTRRRLLLLSLAAACILFSLPGFVKNTVTIRVDIALVFFYVATLVCACRWVFTERPRWLYFAALLLPFAFLSKGLIGPALVGCSLLALLPEILQQGTRHWRQHAGHYVNATLVFLVPVMIWMLLMYRHGGTGLLSFWLFDNQLGRFSGGGQLGHEASGELFYYLGPLAEYLGPWLLFMLAWLMLWLWCAVRRQAVPGEDRVLLLFFLLPMLLLSAASSKRPVYMIPLLPVCAVALAMFFARPDRARPGGAAIRRWARGIGLSCVVFTLLIATMALLPVPAPDSLTPYLEALGAGMALAILLTGLALGWLIWRLRSAWKMMALGVSYVILLLSYAYFPAINEYHGQHRNLQALLAKLDPELLQQTAGRCQSEALQGYLYSYTRRGFVPLTDPQVAAVLSGEDARYRCVLYSGVPEPGLPPHRVVALMPENAQEDQLALLCRLPLNRRQDQ